MWMCGDKVGAAADLKKLSVHPQAQMHSTVLYFRQRAVCSTKKNHRAEDCIAILHAPKRSQGTRRASPSRPFLTGTSTRRPHPTARRRRSPPPGARPPWTAGVPVAGHGSRSGDWCGESEFFYI
jgi:hypothetical protein